MELDPKQVKSLPRSIPANFLDLQMQITDPAWQNLSPELQAKLMRNIGEQIEKEIVDGQEVEVKKQVYEKLSGVLAVYTRDIRLGNLSSFNGEFEFVSYYLELAVDLLQDGKPDACVVALNKALARLELSSSRGGFLRKLFNTFRSENVSSSIEPEKRNIMGGNKK